VAGLILGLVSLSFCLTELRAWYRESRLIRKGTAVQARVEEVEGLTVAGKTRNLRPETPFRLSFPWNDDRREVMGRGEDLGGRSQLTTGDTITLRVDPKNPDRWTARDQPSSLLGRIWWGLLIPLPIMFVLLVVSVARRSAVLRAWRGGEAVAALVVETRQSAVAPLSTVVRCTPADESDNRVLTVYVPRRFGRPRHGDPLWLLVPAGKSEGAVAAAWFL
jgi:hypothetical protein